MTWPTKDDFVDGDVLTAAQVNNIADNLNVFDPTSATNGQVWAANGTGGGAYTTLSSGNFNLIVPTSVSVVTGTATIATSGTVTYNGVGTLNVNGVFTSTYKNYMIVWSAIDPTAQNEPRFRLRVGGVDNSTASSYLYQRYTASNTSNIAARLTSNEWELPTIYNGNYRPAHFMTIYRPQTTDRTSAYIYGISADSTPAALLIHQTMLHNVTTAYDGFSWRMVSGTVSGNVSVYGLSD